MIVIVNYGMGNLGSIQNLIKKVGSIAEVSSDPPTIMKADAIILPGVGAFDEAVRNLTQLNLMDVLRQQANSGKPFLGICLGMQLLANNSEEGKLDGLGLVPGMVKKFDLSNSYKIPHMGWNLVHYDKASPLFKGFDEFEETRFYFVHSFHFVTASAENIMTTTSYGSDFTSGVRKGNIFGVQFHPEKSHKFGMVLMKNFIRYANA